MPKSKIDHAQAAQDVRASWESRGFRADYLASRQYDRDDDPASELAYQRAFAEAVKKDPPRLPNPSHYPNSPSAQTFLQKRNKEFFNSRPATTDAPNPKYESPIPDYWRARHESASPTMAQQQQQQHHQQQQQQPPPQQQQSFMPPPPPPTPLQPTGYAQANGDPYGQSPTMSRTLPSPMEPQMGAPMGPPTRFR